MEQPANDGQLTIRDDQRELFLIGLQVQDGILMVQVIEKLLKTGALAGNELYPLGIVRERIVQSISQATKAEPQKVTETFDDMVKE